MWIGGNSPYGEYFNGRIDEVRVYRAALSQAEIQTDMANPVTPGPNAPKLVITAPAEGSTSTGGTLNVSYTTTGDLTGVDHVHFQVDNDPVKMDLSLDGTYALSGVHVGSHTLNGWLVRADHSKIGGTDAVPVHFSNVVDPADPTSPTVAITSPANGATISGTSFPRRTPPTTSASTAFSSSSTVRRSVSRTSPPRTRRGGTRPWAATARMC